mgnify:CR=1 FL=1
MRRGEPFDTALERGLASLAEVDRRLVHELAAGVLRQQGPLDTAIAPHVSREIGQVEPALLDILRLATYQIHHLDRVPPHAAVATAVDLARQAVGERATGFVNAVLRKVARGRPAPAAPEPDTAAALAGEFSHPEWLVTRWLERFGRDETRALLEWNNAHPPLVIQPARGSVDELANRLGEAKVPHFLAPFGAGVVVDETRPDRIPGFDEGDWFVQDPAQALVTRYAGFPEDAVVYDACAAPGGKALALHDSVARVVAADLSRRRLERLLENLSRLAAPNVHPVVADAMQPPVRPVGAVLVDAPCLGTGTFARHPDARHRVRPEALARLVAEQAALLDAAADRVRTGGVLCYATCSLEPEEDGEQVDRFLARRRDFRREPATGDDLPLTAAGDLLLLPQRHGTDGAFAARLVRTG